MLCPVHNSVVMAGQTVNYVTCPHQDILLLVNVRHPGTGLCQPGQIETPHLQYKIRNKTDGLWLSSQKIKNQEFSVTYRMIDTYTFLQTVYLFSPRISIPFTRVLSLISKIVANLCWLKCENITIFCILTSKYNKRGLVPDGHCSDWNISPTVAIWCQWSIILIARH